MRLEPRAQRPVGAKAPPEPPGRAQDAAQEALQEPPGVPTGPLQKFIQGNCQAKLTNPARLRPGFSAFLCCTLRAHWFSERGQQVNGGPVFNSIGIEITNGNLKA